MEAVLSGRYDTEKLAIMMTQTGGCCQASNYIGFIRRALDKANLGHIPVISLNANGMENNPGFHITLPMLLDAGRAIVYGDLFLRCLYRVRPYEKTCGAANALHKKWEARCISQLLSGTAFCMRLGPNKPEEQICGHYSNECIGKTYSQKL